MTPLALALVLAASPPQETRLSIDVKDANVLDVVRLLAEVGGFQVVADAGISCTLTLKLKDVEWPTVLDLALRSCALADETDGNVVRIAPAARLLEEAAERRRLDEARRLNRPLRTDVYRLSYARAQSWLPCCAASSRRAARSSSTPAPTRCSSPTSSRRTRVTCCGDSSGSPVTTAKCLDCQSI